VAERRALVRLGRSSRERLSSPIRFRHSERIQRQPNHHLALAGDEPCSSTRRQIDSLRQTIDCYFVTGRKAPKSAVPMHRRPGRPIASADLDALPSCVYVLVADRPAARTARCRQSAADL
jgi:hypothetical protein